MHRDICWFKDFLFTSALESPRDNTRNLPSSLSLRSNPDNPGSSQIKRFSNPKNKDLITMQ